MLVELFNFHARKRHGRFLFQQSDSFEATVVVVELPRIEKGQSGQLAQHLFGSNVGLLSVSRDVLLDELRNLIKLRKNFARRSDGVPMAFFGLSDHDDSAFVIFYLRCLSFLMREGARCCSEARPIGRKLMRLGHLLHMRHRPVLAELLDILLGEQDDTASHSHP